MARNELGIGEVYILLAFETEQFLKNQIGDETIIVDSYFGPPELRPDKKEVDPDSLLKEIDQLQIKVKKHIRENPRRSYLLGQLKSLALLIRYGLDEKLTFEERVKIGLDVDVVTVSNERIDELTEQADRAL